MSLTPEQHKHKMMMQRTRRAGKKALGQCIDCGAAHDTEHDRCPVCHPKHLAISRKAKAKLARGGVKCKRCNRPLVPGIPGIFCPVCREPEAFNVMQGRRERGRQAWR